MKSTAATDVTCPSSVRAKAGAVLASIADRYSDAFLRVITAMSVFAAICLASGCAALAENEIRAVESRHGVNIEVTDAGAAADCLGGNARLVLQNIDRELAYFPYNAKKGTTIYIAGSADLLAESKTLGEILSTPLTVAAVQDRPGKTQGHVYVLNKDLWGSYMNLFQPDSTGLQSPHLRHEMMHAWEISALKRPLFHDRRQEFLDQRLGQPDEMLHKLAHIDSLSLLASDSEIVGNRAGPYVNFCARWMAAMFGDVNRDGTIDEEDRNHLTANAPGFDADGNGMIDHNDAAAHSGVAYSCTSGIDPITQLGMTVGLLGYKPKGFASVYGQTCPWEDKAEVLSFAIHRQLLPTLYRKTEQSEIDKAYRQLDDIRKNDPILARKIEVLALFLGSLEESQNLNARFTNIYGDMLMPATAADRTAK